MSSNNHPIILIPGFTGSRLKTEYGNDPAYDIWINLDAIYGPSGQANTQFPSQWWIDQMMLDSSGMIPKESPEFNMSLQGLQAISVLDPTPGMENTRYFYNLI